MADERTTGSGRMMTDAERELLAASQERIERARLEVTAATIARNRVITQVYQDGHGVMPTAQAIALTAGRRRALDAARTHYPVTEHDPTGAELLASLPSKWTTDVQRETPARVVGRR